ncbi:MULTISPECIES: hypothetical protein [unclassified Chitinophaga]|uniref:hypothetical protein n=1 Tax=unclassified Chitinophaga TaxID=2619133 RepID=UPI0030104F53
MKKLTTSLVLSIVFPATMCVAQNKMDQTDSIRIQKQVRDLHEDLADLKQQREKLLLQIPRDSIGLEKAIEASHDWQIKSRNSARKAVGGTISENKRSEKDARSAKQATVEAEEYEGKLQKERQKLTHLTEKIAKVEEKIMSLQAKISGTSDDVQH